MLVLGRYSGQSVLIGDSIAITIIQIADGSVRIGIIAPRQIEIVRTEILERVVETIAKLF